MTADPAAARALPRYRAKGPPSRLSADPKDPWHDKLWVPYAAVFLDGKRVNKCTAYDTRGGWIEAYCWPIRREGDRLATERLRGVVTVRDVATLEDPIHDR